MLLCKPCVHKQKHLPCASYKDKIKKWKKYLIRYKLWNEVAAYCKFFRQEWPGIIWIIQSTCSKRKTTNSIFSDYMTLPSKGKISLLKKTAPRRRNAFTDFTPNMRLISIIYKNVPIKEKQSVNRYMAW